MVAFSVLLDGVPCRVLGVLPASFRFYDGRADAWLEGARAEMRTTAARLETDPASNRAVRAIVTPLWDRRIGEARRTLCALMFAVAGVF